mgnify:CR=1 FL=1
MIELDNSTLTLTEDIMQGHKFALKVSSLVIPLLNMVIPLDVQPQKFPQVPGFILTISKTGLGDLLLIHTIKNVTELPHQKPKFFQGYRRKDGRVGVRNEIWIIPTVGCVNNVASAIERASQKYMTDQIDGVCAFSPSLRMFPDG